jgi:hypothetical protein
MVENVLLDGGSSVNIMTKELRKQLKLLMPKPTFWMADQTITKPIGLIKDLKVHIQGIPYIATFTILKNNDLDSNYSMLLVQPWLHNAHVTHDWGNNLITIKGNGMVQTIVVTKHLDNNTKCLEVLLCYDLMEGVIDEKKEIHFLQQNQICLH